MLVAFVSGLMASFSGCTLPVLSIMASKLSDKSFSPWKFVSSFFLSQFLIFSLLNLSIAGFYSLFESLQPIVLLLASVFTFSVAAANYLGKNLGKVPGSLYGIALAPCNLGFAVFQASSSVSYIKAVANALGFALGMVSPIAAIALFSVNIQRELLRHGSKIERISFILLVIISYYLAYLAGSSWRWWP